MKSNWMNPIFIGILIMVINNLSTAGYAIKTLVNVLAVAGLLLIGAAYAIGRRKSKD
ncbi:LPXTG cell wall anchor domain-containing protein [Peribacillus sp. SCS-37]|uniref:LPXTG cell wall anchor domain-containing protein n=1 Tax=Paraperibacillus esterisolvens TaxID=3115296 RepID=UPI003905CD1C